MNDKVTVVLSDDSDDEICAVYTINKEGVIVIDDDSETTIITTPCSEGTNVKENKRRSRLKNNAELPSTSGNENRSASHKSSSYTQVKTSTQDPNIDTKKTQSPSKTKINSILKEKQVVPCSNSLSNPDNNTDFLKSTNSNKLSSTSNGIKQPGCTSTNNKTSVRQSSSDRKVFLMPGRKRCRTEDTNFVITIEDNSSDTEKKNCPDKCTVPPAINNWGQPTSHKRRRTQSPPVRKTSSESVLRQRSKHCSKHANSNSTGNVSWQSCSHLTYEKSARTKSAPCTSTSSKHSYVSHEQNRTQSASSSTSTRVAGKQTLTVNSSFRPVLSTLQTSNLPTDSLENLSTFLHIIFIDLDNWGRFFYLPYPLPPKVFVWGFCGGNFQYKQHKPKFSVHFLALVREKRFFQHPKCGKSKNAADFALCMQAARLDLQLPMHIPFTVLSGDKGFGELRTQLESSARQIHLVDPHHKDPGMLYATLASIGST